MTKTIALTVDDKSIIDYIKKERKRLKITQEQLAEKLQLSKSLINMAETYRHKYSDLTLKKIYQVLDLTPIEKEIKDKISTYEIDLSPMVQSNRKIKFKISDKIIDNIIDLKNIPLKRKEDLLLEKDRFPDYFIKDFNENSQNYYVVMIDDDYLKPLIESGFYLIIKYIENNNELPDSPFYILVLEDSKKEILIRYVKIIKNYIAKDKIFYAYLFDMPETQVKDNIWGIHYTKDDFYFKENEIKIIGYVLCAINPEIPIWGY